MVQGHFISRAYTLMNILTKVKVKLMKQPTQEKQSAYNQSVMHIEQLALLTEV